LKNKEEEIKEAPKEEVLKTILDTKTLPSTTNVSITVEATEEVISPILEKWKSNISNLTSSGTSSKVELSIVFPGTGVQIFTALRKVLGRDVKIKVIEDVFTYEQPLLDKSLGTANY
jgi:hypothetical protein